MKTFTLAEVADAIEKNGLPQTFNWYFRTSDGEGFNDSETSEYAAITAACAVGQACINLGVETDWVTDLDVIDDIIMLNDKEKKSFKEIADHIRANYDLETTISAQEFEYLGVVQ